MKAKVNSSLAMPLILLLLVTVFYGRLKGTIRFIT